MECSVQQLYKFIGTKESVYITKDFNSHRIGLGHQHGCCGVMWKHSIAHLRYCLSCKRSVTWPGRSCKCFPKVKKIIRLHICEMPCSNSSLQEFYSIEKLVTYICSQFDRDILVVQQVEYNEMSHQQLNILYFWYTHKPFRTECVYQENTSDKWDIQWYTRRAFT